MSAPMEVYLPNGSDLARLEAIAQPVAVACSTPAPVDDKILVSVEVQMNPSSIARVEEVRKAVKRMLEFGTSIEWTAGAGLVFGTVLVWSGNGPILLNEDDTLSSFNEWALPAKEFDGLWESLLYESGLKQRLLRYAASALLFTARGVNTCLVSWNR